MSTSGWSGTKIRRSWVVATAVTAVSMPTAAQAQPAEGSGPSFSIEQVATEFRDLHGIPKLVVVVVGPDGVHRVALGGAHGATRFEAGSVTKVFTGLLLAEMSVRDELDPEDPVAQHLSHAQGGNPALAEIRLYQLATHTSGLPRLPPDLAPVTFADPYAEYDEARLEALLARIKPTRGPHASYEYSNLGAGVLGHALARRGDAPFPELVHDRLIAPLGLHGAGFAEDGPAEGQIAPPHSDTGEVPGWRFAALVGAGGMWSSADDLVCLLVAQIDPPAGPLGEAIRLTQRKWAAGPGGVRLGLGWHIIELPGTGSVYFHNGGTGGSRAFVGFAPDAEAGVVVLANRNLDLAAVDALGLRLLREAAGVGGKP